MPASKGDLTSKNIMVREDQDEWLDENDWLNLSAAVRDMIDERMGE